jgi:Transposase DDE domain group 1
VSRQGTEGVARRPDRSAEVSRGLRLRLLKIAARVVETASRVRLAFAAACPEADLFRSLPGALLPLGP